jgi:AcrR family transcriptional regulator
VRQVSRQRKTASGKAAGPPRAERADARRNRERVLEVARKLFEEKGPDVEIDEVARRAGVGVGTLYRQFPNKQALIQGVLFSHVEPLAAAGLAKADAADPGNAFFAHLEFLADAFLAKENVHLAIARAGLGEESHTPQQDAMARSLEALLARAQNAGAVRRDVSASELVLLIRSTLFPPQHASVPQAVRRRLFDVVVQGLKPAGAKRAR